MLAHHDNDVRRTCYSRLVEEHKLCTSAEGSNAYSMHDCGAVGSAPFVDGTGDEGSANAKRKWRGFLFLMLHFSYRVFSRLGVV